METRAQSRPAMAVVRWSWVVVLTFFTLIGLALALASGFLTLPFALTTGGLALWLARGGPGEKPGAVSLWLVGIGMAGIVLTLILLLLA